MAENTLVEPEIDALSGLEERIHHAITLVGTLRKERDSAVKDLSEVQAENERLTAELDRSAKEVASLREERTQVRARIEKLLGHIDQLSL